MFRLFFLYWILPRSWRGAFLGVLAVPALLFALFLAFIFATSPLGMYTLRHVVGDETFNRWTTPQWQQVHVEVAATPTGAWRRTPAGLYTQCVMRRAPHDRCAFPAEEM